MIDDYTRRMARDLASQEETMIEDGLRLRFGYQARVTIRKPRWMPEPVYRRLMRTIVVEVKP